MERHTDIEALIKRLRGSIHDAAWKKHALVQEAADALEAQQRALNAAADMVVFLRGRAEKAEAALKEISPTSAKR